MLLGVCGRVSRGITSTKRPGSSSSSCVNGKNEEREVGGGGGGSTGLSSERRRALPFLFFAPFPCLFFSPRPCRKPSILAARSAALYPSVGNPWAHAVPPFRILVTTLGCHRARCCVAGCGRLLWGGMWGELQSTQLRHRSNHAGLPTRGRAGRVLRGRWSRGLGGLWPALLGDGLSVVDSWIPALNCLGCVVAASRGLRH